MDAPAGDAGEVIYHAMSRYVEILASQRPFPYAVDGNGRTMFSVNFSALAASPVARFEEEIAIILSDVGLATLSVDTFIGPSSVMPKGEGPYTTIIDTGGRDPDETHDASLYERLSVQIIVRDTSYQRGRARALAIWRALDGQRNITVVAA